MRSVTYCFDELGEDSMLHHKVILAALFFSMLLGHSLAAEEGTQPLRRVGYDRPAKNPHQSRSAIAAEHGIVATSQPLAAQAGLEILKQGGTAADAAIATNAMIGLVEPMSCGIGGDIFVIYWDAKTQKLYGLNGSGRSPYKLNREVFAQKGLKEIPSEGPLCWNVPGCVAGWEELRGAIWQEATRRVIGTGDRLRRARLSRQRDHRRRMELFSAVPFAMARHRQDISARWQSAKGRPDLPQPKSGAQLSRYRQSWA